MVIARRPTTPTRELPATWRQADPARIARAVELAEARNAGGWYVVAPSAEIGSGRSSAAMIAGREVVLWRTGTGALHAGPGACPHMGALLDDCPVIGNALRCTWHGLALGPAGTPQWRPLAAHDDGVFAWVQLPTPGERPTERPALPDRPPAAGSIAATIRVDGRCEPVDIVANRLDPWHGSWFHPYAFSHLTVDDDASDDDRLVVDVTFRLTRRFGVPVRATFSCPDSRSIVMQITDGDGAGSVVETHATPVAPDATGAPRTAMHEATIAYSDRPGFRAAHAAAALIRPAIRRTARRLWVDDLVYAERRYDLRTRAAEVGELRPRAPRRARA